MKDEKISAVYFQHPHPLVSPMGDRVEQFTVENGDAISLHAPGVVRVVSKAHGTLLISHPGMTLAVARP